MAIGRQIIGFGCAEEQLVGKAERQARCGVAGIVEGGELLGFASGNPCCEDQYGSDTCHTFKGRALAIIRAKEPGEINVHVISKTLAPGHARVKAETL
jgi:hypothetical protein